MVPNTVPPAGTSSLFQWMNSVAQLNKTMMTSTQRPSVLWDCRQSMTRSSYHTGSNHHHLRLFPTTRRPMCSRPIQLKSAYSQARERRTRNRRHSKKTTTRRLGAANVSLCEAHSSAFYGFSVLGMFYSMPKSVYFVFFFWFASFFAHAPRYVLLIFVTAYNIFGFFVSQPFNSLQVLLSPPPVVFLAPYFGFRRCFRAARPATPPLSRRGFYRCPLVPPLPTI